MIVSIENKSYGESWGKYVLRDDAVIIAGNPKLGDSICKSLDYKSGNSINFVLSFSKNDCVGQSRGRDIAQDFVQHFMRGFNEDEYHLDIVEHNDTKHLHYHIRIPKINLLTQTQLKLYWHKTDLKFKKATIDLIAKKYDLSIGSDHQKGYKLSNDIARISKWRRDHNQKLDITINLAKKKDRLKSEVEIFKYLDELLKSGLINSLEDTEAALKDLGLEIAKKGYDKTNDFYYFTIQNDSGKMRLKGDIFDDKYYRKNKQSEGVSIARAERIGSDNTEAYEVYKRELDKRLQRIETQYASARKRATERREREFKKEPNSSQKRGNNSIKDDRRRSRKVSKKTSQKHQKNTISSVDYSRYIFTPNPNQLDWHNSDFNRLHFAPKTITANSRIEQNRESNQESQRDERRAGEVLSDKRVVQQRIYDREETIGQMERPAESVHRDILLKRKKQYDSIRREINARIGDITRGIYSRVSEDNGVIRNEYEQCNDSYQKAEGSYSKLREYIEQFKYRVRRELERATQFYDRKTEKFFNGFDEFKNRVGEFVESTKKLVSRIEYLKEVKDAERELIEERKREEEYQEYQYHSPSPGFGW
jgi:hypothetical protein